METKKVAKEYLQKDILRTIFQMWYSFYTTEIGKERKAAIEDMRFKRDGWLYIEPWEIWLELTEHPENEDDRIIWYQNMHGIWKKAEVNDQIIKIPATAFHIEYEQQWLGEIHFTCNLGVSQRKRKAPRKKRYAYWMEGFCRKYRISCSGQILLWSSIFVTLMANKIGGLQFGIYRNCQISSRVFHTAVAALPLTKANRSDFE